MPDATHDHLAGVFPTEERASQFMHALVRAFDEAGTADDWAIFTVGTAVYLHHRTEDERLRHLYVKYTLTPPLLLLALVFITGRGGLGGRGA